MVIILLIGLLGFSPVLGFINGHGGRIDVEGCLRGGVYYASGATVPSEELCEDCACKDGEVTCAMQKCRAPRYNCRPVGFIKGTCCPLKFECDDEINQLVPETPFSNSDEKKFRNSATAKSCVSKGQRYLSGQSVPVFSPCQTSCACVDGSIACNQSVCPPAPPAFLRCTKFEVLNECCPEYDCLSTDHSYQTKCVHEGVSYEDGEFVPNSDQCSDCYCIEGEILCAHLVCPDPPANNCTPVTSSHQMCCPQKYECFDVPPLEIDTVETPLTTEGTIEDKESTTANGELDSTNSEGTDLVTKPPMGDSEVTENDNMMATDESTYAPVDASEVTENNKEVGEEKLTTIVVEEGTEESTIVVEEGTEESASTGVDFTTPEPQSASDKTEITTVPYIGELTSEPIQTTISDVDYESTTMKKIDETPVGSTSSSISTDETTINLNTNGYDNNDGLTTVEPLIEATKPISWGGEETTIDYIKHPLVTDDVTTEPSTDYSTVTDDSMFTETTTVEFGDMCSNNGNFYSDGDSIPPTSQCQESCQCRNGTVTCIEKACSSAPPAFLRCASIEIMEGSDECCPKYDCPPPSPGPASPECVKDGIQYYEGEFVPSADHCTDCYCMYGEILCAFLECSPPVRDSCTPINDDERACCPEHYECDIEGDIQTTTMYQSEEPTTMYQTEEPEAPADLSLLKFWL